MKTKQDIANDNIDYTNAVAIVMAHKAHKAAKAAKAPATTGHSAAKCRLHPLTIACTLAAMYE